jgi:signal transduction histidine kinase
MLRKALEAVRATLNVDLVLRAIVREAVTVSNADEGLIVVRGSQLDVPDLYSISRASRDASLERRSLDPATSTFFERASEDAKLVSATPDDPVANMILDLHHAKSMILVRITGADKTVVLFLFGQRFARGMERLLQAFADSAGVALDQSWLFMQLGYRNEEIAAQRDTLENRNRIIRDIVYALAHDLRTPLSATNMTMQQALDGAYGELPETYKSVLRSSLSSNADVRRLVETLLLVARFESGESSTLRERVDVNVEAQRVTDELRPLAEAKPITLECSCAPATIVGDASEIRRAISNLLANAIEATPSGGHVTLSVSSLDERVEVKVEDDGYGIPLEQRAQLFERFATNGRAYGSGTGLGLYIVRLIAEKAGGRVSYQPREPRGSTFTMSLPTAPEHVNV